jgi:hypothetical protein
VPDLDRRACHVRDGRSRSRSGSPPTRDAPGQRGAGRAGGALPPRARRLR